MTKPILLTLVLLMGSAATARGAVARIGQPVMGTVLEITVVADDPDTARRLGELALAEARHWEDVLTTWHPDGELAQFNARAGSGPVALSTDLLGALRRMLELSERTGGAFDPAVGPLVQLWRSSSGLPPSAPASEPRYRIGLALTIREGSAELLPGAALDTGAIGKGMALDAVARQLRAHGASAAFLDFGGSSQLALGAPPDSPRGWAVAVSGLGKGEIHGILYLRDAALSTSRALSPAEPSGVIIDPRSGQPVTPPRLATVLAPDATTAEAWSTALIVLGRDPLERLEGVKALYQDDTGTSRSPGFELDAAPAGLVPPTPARAPD